MALKGLYNAFDMNKLSLGYNTTINNIVFQKIEPCVAKKDSYLLIHNLTRIDQKPKVFSP